MMGYLLEFTIPGLPHMTNSRSKNWRAANAEAKKWKKLVHDECLGKRPRWNCGNLKPLTKAKLILTRFSSIPPDSDGLVSGFKHVIDGLVEAGVLENDRFENIGMPDYQWIKVAPKEGRIKVIVESLEVE